MWYFPFFSYNGNYRTTKHKISVFGIRWSELWKQSPHSIPLTHIFGAICGGFKRLWIMRFFWLSLYSLLPVRLLVLPPLVLFDECSLRRSRGFFWPALSLSFVLSWSWLRLTVLTILILIFCSLVTLWCTWLWCGLGDGGNYHRVGGGMLLSLHLLHSDKPKPECVQGSHSCTDSILHPQWFIVPMVCSS